MKKEGLGTLGDVFASVITETFNQKGFSAREPKPPHPAAFTCKVCGQHEPEPFKTAPGVDSEAVGVPHVCSCCNVCPQCGLRQPHWRLTVDKHWYCRQGLCGYEATSTEQLEKDMVAWWRKFAAELLRRTDTTRRDPPYPCGNE